jgi:hypothetical protein
MDLQEVYYQLLYNLENYYQFHHHQIHLIYHFHQGPDLLGLNHLHHLQ